MVLNNVYVGTFLLLFKNYLIMITTLPLIVWLLLRARTKKKNVKKRKNCASLNTYQYFKVMLEQSDCQCEGILTDPSIITGGKCRKGL